MPQCGTIARVNGRPEITVLQTSKFKAEALDLIGQQEIEAIADHLIDNPDAGSVVPGLGGARKLRWAAKGKGKRGGARVIYLYIRIDAEIYLLRCYAKNTQADLTQRERREVRTIVAQLKGER